MSSNLSDYEKCMNDCQRMFNKCTIKFGKYKGELMKDVAIKDPKYMLWMYDNLRENSKNDYFVVCLQYWKKNNPNIENEENNNKVKNIQYQLCLFDD